MLKHADKYRITANAAELAAYFVRVRWLDAVPQNKAANDVGLFGNQNSVSRATTPKWRHTVDRLKIVFSIWATRGLPPIRTLAIKTLSRDCSAAFESVEDTFIKTYSKPLFAPSNQT